MPDGPYAKVAREELILRDYLATDRTILANERTFLAYIRTALAFFLSGISLVKFFGALLFEIIGWVLIPLGAMTCVIGLMRYLKMNRLVRRITTDTPPRSNLG
jgi:putative membrane protein